MENVILKVDGEDAEMTVEQVQELVTRLENEVREQRKNGNMWYKNYMDEYETRKKVLRAFKSVVDVAIATSTPYTDELGNL